LVSCVCACMLSVFIKVNELITDYCTDLDKAGYARGICTPLRDPALSLGRG